METNAPSSTPAVIFLSNLPKHVTAADVEKLLFEVGRRQCGLVVLCSEVNDIT